jgi:hypothetical protein
MGLRRDHSTAQRKLGNAPSFRGKPLNLKQPVPVVLRRWSGWPVPAPVLNFAVLTLCTIDEPERSR